MVARRDFNVESVQVSLFTPDHSTFAASRVVAAILRRFGDRFNGEMQVLPVPPDVPAEIPRITLQSDDDRWRLNVGPARLDLIWRQLSDEVEVEIAEVVRQCVEIGKHYATEVHARVGRLGFVLQHTCEVENPAQALIQRFCNTQVQEEPFNRSATFEIHNHKEYVPARNDIDYRINSWVRCRSAKSKRGDRPIIRVIQDLNTMANEQHERSFNASAIDQFYEMARTEADEILGKYFPDSKGAFDAEND